MSNVNQARKASILQRLANGAFKVNKIQAKIPSLYAPLFTNDYIYFVFTEVEVVERVRM